MKDSITTPKKDLEDLLLFLGICQEHREWIRYTLLSNFSLDDIRELVMVGAKEGAHSDYKKNIISTIILVNRIIDITVSAGSLRYKLDEHGKIDQPDCISERGE
tara:strand:+ start:172 stop:483 length:312 start_codon:yes stop_codon:yes gene_type:complete